MAYSDLSTSTLARETTFFVPDETNFVLDVELNHQEEKFSSVICLFSTNIF